MLSLYSLLLVVVPVALLLLLQGSAEGIPVQLAPLQAQWNPCNSSLYYQTRKEREKSCKSIPVSIWYIYNIKIFFLSSSFLGIASGKGEGDFMLNCYGEDNNLRVKWIDSLQSTVINRDHVFESKGMDRNRYHIYLYLYHLLHILYSILNAVTLMYVFPSCFPKVWQTFLITGGKWVCNTLVVTIEVMSCFQSYRCLFVLPIKLIPILSSTTGAYHYIYGSPQTYGLDVILWKDNGEVVNITTLLTANHHQDPRLLKTQSGYSLFWNQYVPLPLFLLHPSFLHPLLSIGFKCGWFNWLWCYSISYYDVKYATFNNVNVGLSEKTIASDPLEAQKTIDGRQQQR